MNEFDLQGWEREIRAWQRRLEHSDVPAMRQVLDEIERDVGQLRAHPEREAEERPRVEQRLLGLFALYHRPAAAAPPK